MRQTRETHAKEDKIPVNAIPPTERFGFDRGMADMSRSDLRTLLQHCGRNATCSFACVRATAEAQVDTVETKSPRYRGCNANVCGSFVPERPIA